MHRVITFSAIVIAALVSSTTASAATSAPSSTSTTSMACPFCSAIALTFSEQLGSNDIAVVAKLIEIPPDDNDPNADFPKAKFEIHQVLKGDKFVATEMKFKTQLVGSYDVGEKFLVMGVDPPTVAWTTPMKASDRVFKYLEEIQTLPESGPERLTFFQDYFEDEESVLAFDAYDEFARAPYEDLIAMKDQMERDKLLGWIKDTETSVTRRRLYFTMLGVCGKEADADLLEEFITSGSRKKRAGLDALIACYLTLKGGDGVDLIEKTFLSDHEADYVDTLAAVSALRFHGTEVEIVPKKRIVTAVRHLLDRPKMADMIIPDLARWEDWSVMERLVKMFKEADEESNWLRVPVVTYLRACPKPEAKTYIEELRKVDPEAVKRADFFLGVGDDDWDDDDDSDESETPMESDSEPTVETEKIDGANTATLTPPAEDEPKEQSDSKTEESTNEKAKNQESNGPGKQEASESQTKSEKTSARSSSENHVVKRVPMTDENPPATDSQIPAQTFASENDISDSAQPIGTETVASDPNLVPAEFVSTSGDSMATTVPQVAQAVPPSTPIAVATPSANLTWSIIFIPMAISLAIFLLLWSVVNGWFERLIF